jgi:hypothetical protein
MSVTPAVQEAYVGGSQSEASPRQKCKTLSGKITKIKKGWEYGSVGRALLASMKP